MTSAALRRYVPAVSWLAHYRRADLPGDLTAGTIVGIMLVPQGMAYALLAGLPPYVGLYAGILPPLLYGLFGTSRALAVGPVGIASLMVASAVSGIAAPGSAEHLAAALMLALLSGAMLLGMGMLRLGFVVNFLSHPVISGFTSAAALTIAVSQFKHLLGTDVTLAALVQQPAELVAAVNPVTTALGAGSILALLLWRGPLATPLRTLGVPDGLVAAITRSGPIVVVLGATAVAGAFELHTRAGLGVVGDIPSGLPPLTLPSADMALLRTLLPSAALIALVGFLESVSVAKALASKRRQKIDADQELRALGLANLGAAFTGGYPVAGGFGRSMVNFAAGAATPLASLLAAFWVALAVLLFTPLFHHLPHATLAAVIVVAVSGLVDLGALRRAWLYDRTEAAALVATFVAVLFWGVEPGIVLGVGLSLLLHLWRTSRPHIAVVGRVGDSEHFRNVLRHKVQTVPEVLAIRVDESLYFANAGWLESRLLAAVADDRRIRHVVLICSAVNGIDGSALETLETLREELGDAGVTLHLAEVKGPVMDRLQRTAFVDRLQPGRVFLSTHAALLALTEASEAVPPKLSSVQ